LAVDRRGEAKKRSFEEEEKKRRAKKRMGNCIVIQHERSWVDDEEDDFEFSEKQNGKWLGEKERMVEVKVKITKKQLQELLGSKRMPIEKALEEIMQKGSVCREQFKEGQWRPRLQSIPEVQEER
jgi:predicted HTH transcriptional regulator